MPSTRWRLSLRVMLRDQVRGYQLLRGASRFMVRPSWETKKSVLELRKHISIGGLVVGAIDIAPIGHHALPVANGKLADIDTHGRLMIDGTKCNRADGRVDLQVLGCLDQVVGLGRAGRLDRLCQRQRI